jgi:hypothetical protein
MGRSSNDGMMGARKKVAKGSRRSRMNNLGKKSADLIKKSSLPVPSLGRWPRGANRLSKKDIEDGAEDIQKFINDPKWPVPIRAPRIATSVAKKASDPDMEPDAHVVIFNQAQHDAHAFYIPPASDSDSDSDLPFYSCRGN